MNIEIQTTTRAGFLVRGALAVAGAWGAGAAGSFTSRALAQTGDLGLLEFAVSLEYVETAFYRRARRIALSAEIGRLAARHAEHEQQHADALLALLAKARGTAPRMPTLRFPEHDEAGFLALAQTLEEAGVGAYNGLTPLLGSRELVAAFASIGQVEARHAAAIRLARGERPAPESFDAGLTTADVRKALSPLVQS
ncbi:MAG: hypothetical protein QOI98_1558 [Solirubrobacteraceae bacterium]|jgi:hypothetical protein|nr:hypothetical protein [Solirubrobacteraceae bacterium]